MKLLNCLRCHTIINITSDKTQCRCEASKARYVNNILVEYSGPCRILGILNPEYGVAAEYHDYKWFIIPEGHNTIYLDNF